MNLARQCTPGSTASERGSRSPEPAGEGLRLEVENLRKRLMLAETSAGEDPASDRAEVARRKTLQAVRAAVDQGNEQMFAEQARTEQALRAEEMASASAAEQSDLHSKRQRTPLQHFHTCLSLDDGASVPGSPPRQPLSSPPKDWDAVLSSVRSDIDAMKLDNEARLRQRDALILSLCSQVAAVEQRAAANAGRLDELEGGSSQVGVHGAGKANDGDLRSRVTELEALVAGVDVRRALADLRADHARLFEGIIGDVQESCSSFPSLASLAQPGTSLPADFPTSAAASGAELPRFTTYSTGAERPPASERGYACNNFISGYNWQPTGAPPKVALPGAAASLVEHVSPQLRAQPPDACRNSTAG